MKRIAVETKKKMRFEKLLEEEKKQKKSIEKQGKKKKMVNAQKDKQRDAERKLDTEVLHQKEEAETRALTKTMMSDAAAKKPSLNNSCLNVLNNFQGKKTFFSISLQT